MWGISYWVLPVISGLCWLGTLLGLLIHWLSGTQRRRYPSMDPSQSVAYISDVGAFELKPLFITGAVVMTVFLDLSFLCERWLRHQRRLVPNLTMTEKLLSGFSIVFAAIGTVGLISLSCLDTYHHPTLHDVFLIVFIVGFVVNAILVCAEYQRLGIKNRQHPILRASFWIKLFFVVISVCLAIAFGIRNTTHHWNSAAVLEWTIAFIFTFYIASFFIDLLPAVRTRHNRYSNNTQLEHEVGPGRGDAGEMGQYDGSPVADEPTNGRPVGNEKPPVASNF